LREIIANRRQAVEAARKAQMVDSFEIGGGLGYFWSMDAQCNLDYLTPAAFSNLGWNHKAVTGTPISNHLLPAEDPDKGNERPLSFLLSARNSITGLTCRRRAAKGVAKRYFARTISDKND